MIGTQAIAKITAMLPRRSLPKQTEETVHGAMPVPVWIRQKLGAAD
jgi:hypothetical protein